MKKLSNAVSNPFQDEAITTSRLYNFSVYMLNQMQLNPNANPQWNAAKDQLANAITPVQAALDAVDVNKTQQKSKTVTVDSVVISFKEAIEANYYKIVAIFAPDTPEYQEFFPQGKSQYNRLTRANTETLMNRMKNATNAHVAQLGAPIRDAFANYPAQYTTARNTQLTAIGTTDISIDGKGTLQTTLAANCWQALAFIIYVFGDDAATIATYYDESLLLPPQGNRHFYTITLAGNEERNISIPGITPSTTIELENPSTATGHICLPPTPGSPCTGSSFPIAPDEKRTFLITEFASPGATVIRLKNTTPGVARFIVRVHIN